MDKEPTKVHSKCRSLTANSFLLAAQFSSVCIISPHTKHQCSRDERRAQAPRMARTTATPRPEPWPRIRAGRVHVSAISVSGMAVSSAIIVSYRAHGQGSCCPPGRGRHVLLRDGHPRGEHQGAAVHHPRLRRRVWLLQRRLRVQRQRQPVGSLGS